MALLGIDVGTTGCKVAAFTEDGAPIAESYRECTRDVASLQPRRT